MASVILYTGTIEEKVCQWLTNHQESLFDILSFRSSELVLATNILEETTKKLCRVINWYDLSYDILLMIVMKKHRNFHARYMSFPYRVEKVLGLMYQYRNGLPDDHPLEFILRILSTCIGHPHRMLKNRKLLFSVRHYLIIPETTHLYIKWIFGIVEKPNVPWLGSGFKNLQSISDDYEIAHGRSRIDWERNAFKIGCNTNAKRGLDEEGICDLPPPLKQISSSSSSTLPPSNDVIIEAAKGTIFESSIEDTMITLKQLNDCIADYWSFVFDKIVSHSDSKDTIGTIYDITTRLKGVVFDKVISIMISDPIKHLINKYKDDSTSYDVFVATIGDDFINDTMRVEELMKNANATQTDFIELKKHVDLFIQIYTLLV